MKICDYERYQAVYCTLCRTMGKRYGPFARMLLSYDYTFVAMLYMDIEGDMPHMSKGRCTFNPAKRCGNCNTGGDAFEVTAALTAIMFYHKLRDNADDSSLLPKAGWNTLRLFALPLMKKAKKRYPFIAQAVEEYMERQKEAERQADVSPDSAAEPTARLISVLTQMMSEREELKETLSKFGYFLGRWIYFIDALDDLPKDVKDGAFNPFARKFSLTKSDAENRSESFVKACIYANECLNMSIDELITQYDALNEAVKFTCFKPVLDNIIFLGMGNSQRLAMHSKENDNK
jgi:hypothetical protein